MTEWETLMADEDRFRRKTFARALLMAVDEDCLTRKPRDPSKETLMKQLGLPERYPEVDTKSIHKSSDE
ncbi:MAG TPA: hypothetical protein VGB30_00780 [bacterium]|jgi:hypothetical protein